MLKLLLAIAIFTAFHVLPSTPLRPMLIAALGRRAFMVLFSAVSMLLLVWLYLVYKDTLPETFFWVTDTPLRIVTAALMLIAITLAILAFTEKPPVVLTGENVLARPGAVRGVLRITRHPLLWAIVLWGLLHMLNNADPPSWVFFGYMTALALGGTFIIDRRRKQLLAEKWDQIAGETSNLPFLAIITGRNQLVLGELSLWRIALAIVVWGIILIGHEHLFGFAVFQF